MRDTKDSLTVDLFTQSKRVGRPCTSTDEKRRKDAAERARRYRQSRGAGVCVRNVHEVKLCQETERDLAAIFNHASWALSAFDDNGNFIPSHTAFAGADPAHDLQEIINAALAIAKRAGVVWCNPPINRHLWQYRD